MGLFATDTTNYEKQIASLKNENKALKEQLGNSFKFTWDYDENVKSLKALLAVTETLRKLEDGEFSFDVKNSAKFKSNILIDIIDTKTKKAIGSFSATGSEKNIRKSSEGRVWTHYFFTANKAEFGFMGGANVTVPKLFLEDVSSMITQHINNWSAAKDKTESAQLDKALEKVVG